MLILLQLGCNLMYFAGFGNVTVLVRSLACNCVIVFQLSPDPYDAPLSVSCILSELPHHKNPRLYRLILIRLHLLARMVFPGRFNTGCLRCRQRKVKVSDIQ